MIGFYTSIIFLGAVLMIAVIAWILLDRKKSADHGKQLDEKKNELVGIINDADQMIEELNKFSDYIILQVNQKNEELAAKLKDIDERVSYLDSLPKETMVSEAPARYISVNGAQAFEQMKANDLVLDCIEGMKPRAEVEMEKSSSYSKGMDKVIPLNSRYREVLSLTQKGYTQTDIAKSLNMGKGEIQLILEMHK